MSIYVLTNGNDAFDSGDTTLPLPFTNGSEVFGRNGDDSILVAGGSTGLEGLFLEGEEGNDHISADGVSLTVIFGGNGDDSISVTGFGTTVDGEDGDDSIFLTGTVLAASGGNGNDSIALAGDLLKVNGGNGDDSFTSNSFGSAGDAHRLGAGMTGGQGTDSFTLNNTSDLHVATDAGTLNLVDCGDVIVGVIDVITDYEKGELVSIGAAAKHAGTVGLDGMTKNLVLADGEFAIIPGTLTDVGTFEVSATGTDLLVVYDKADGTDEPVFQGAVALLGFAEASNVLFA